jgi:hypothetical protein
MKSAMKGTMKPSHQGRKNARPRRRPNQPPDSAARLSERFHGRPVRKVTTLAQEVAERTELADLGRLIELVVEGAETWALPFGRTDVRVAASPDGGQLYLVGGDQEVDLERLGLAEALPKDHLVVGELASIAYRTSKAFHNFEPTDYQHAFGEESGVRPLLCYDALNRALYIVGGNYQVREEGIVD